MQTTLDMVEYIKYLLETSPIHVLFNLRSISTLPWSVSSQKTVFRKEVWGKDCHDFVDHITIKIAYESNAYF